MNILFLSNGHGEDVITGHLLEAYHILRPQDELYVLPLVGRGLVFSKYPYVKRFTSYWNPPSGGFLWSISSIISDLGAGIITHHFRQIKEANQTRYDLIVCVGDLFPLFVSRWIKTKYRVLIATAKSDLFQPHYAIERFYVKRWANDVYTRDQMTADSLLSYGVTAKFRGNIMMDDVAQEYGRRIKKVERGTEKSKNTPCIGILPGSREEAYPNFERIISVLNHCPKQWDLRIAVPPHLDKKRLNRVPIQQKHSWVSFSEMIDDVDIVIGLAGTANEQCVGCGLAVIAFVGTGPQTTTGRFLEQQKLLLGGVRFINESNSAIISRQIITLIKDKRWLANVRQSGPLVMGPPGASQRIAKELSCIFEY